MTVSFLGAIREITGTSRQSILAPTVRELMEILLRTYGTTWSKHVFDGKGLSAGVVVMVNGQSIHQSEGIATPLSPDDRIDIIPMFEGG